MYDDANFDEQPLVAAGETTQACDPVCVDCRACAETLRHPLELTFEEAKCIIDQIAANEVSVFVGTGGDPLKRPHIFGLVQYATERNVRVSLTPRATPLLTRESIVGLKACGRARLAVSLDGPTAAIHDAFRRVPGFYQGTLEAVRWVGEIGLPARTWKGMATMPVLRDLWWLAATLVRDERAIGSQRNRAAFMSLSARSIHARKPNQSLCEG